MVLRRVGIGFRPELLLDLLFLLFLFLGLLFGQLGI